MAERTRIICPHCDAVVATTPKDGLKMTDLVCSNCGAELRGPGAVEKAADAVKNTIGHMGKSINEALGGTKKR